MIILIELLFILCALLIISECFRRSQVFTYGVCVVLLLFLSYTWMGRDDITLFKWVKIYSASAGVILFTLIRKTKLKEKKWAMYAVYGILALNIFEAVLKDIFIGEISSLLNAATGVLLIITMRGINNIKVEDDNLIWRELDWGWIITYTIWNVLVVLGKDAPVAGRYTILLIAPMITEYIKRGTWLQTRACTLAVMLMYGLGLPNLASRVNIAWFENDMLKLGVGIAGLLCGIIYLLYTIKLRRNMRAANETESV